MKTSIFLFFLLTLLACQKKEFATFQKRSQTQFNNKQKDLIIDLPKPLEANIALPDLKNFNIVEIKTGSTMIYTANNAGRVFNPASVSSNFELPYKSLKNLKSLSTNKPFVKHKTLKSKNLINNTVDSFVNKRLKLKNSSIEETEYDKLAKISLILGISSLVSIFLVGGLAVFVGIAAIITGIISYKKTSKRGMAIWGIALGSLTILTILIALIIFINLIISLFSGY